ncbi:lysophospholipid acyltransferase family protein [Marinobacterium mangrovicola]|uniref:Lauroyl/myristoyl acyltransferase n=1 Tax=Marinobacterium mangrovicola TaxID=1476959 RepID=A0A4R1GIF4_9GAMM|nr:lysophospholipid acyltransferase family protein [Marinobacterium mangrovicola]TCK05659.1 lauroyl/myristoyl acyltransferase [Marinobacterium mangrovicola]
MKEQIELFLARSFSYLPLSWVRKIGEALGARSGRKAIVAKRKWVARLHDNMRRLSGVDSSEEREQRIIDYTRRIGRLYAEIPVLHRLDANGRVEVQGKEHLAQIDRPVIMVSAHLSNWEMIGHLIKHEIKGPWRVLYLPLKSRVRTKLVCEARMGWYSAEPEGSVLLPTDTSSSLRKINRAIAEGKNLLIFVDEEKHDYVWAPSLGRSPFYTGNLWFAARMAVKHQMDILPAYVEPSENGSYKVVVEPLMKVSEDEAAKPQALKLARQMDEALDRWVRQWPEHWYWLPYLELDKEPPSYSSSPAS